MLGYDGNICQMIISAGDSRLFHFKMEIAKIMLCEPKAIEQRNLKTLATQQQSSESDDDVNHFSPSIKRKKETASNIPHITRFDGIPH